MSLMSRVGSVLKMFAKRGCAVQQRHVCKWVMQATLHTQSLFFLAHGVSCADFMNLGVDAAVKPVFASGAMLVAPAADRLTCFWPSLSAGRRAISTYPVVAVNRARRGR